MSLAMAEGREQDRIDQEASEWLVLRESRALDRSEQEAFDAWQNADPRHRATYAAMERTWGDIPQLNSLKELVPLEPEAAPSKRRWNAPRTWAVTAVAAAAAILALLWVPGLIRPEAVTSYETRVAEIRELTLPDGTRVTLGPRTTLAERFSEGERLISLVGGEAFFDVVHNAGRPFLIEAGAALIRVTGTKFNVNAGAASLNVSVLEGSVEVIASPQAGGRAQRPQVLTAGQRLVIASSASEAGAAALPAVERLSVERPGAWREGRLVYENARLSDLVSDLNRYYAPGVTIEDPDVANLRITAAFRASEIPAFMSALGDVVPVRAEETATGGFRLQKGRD